MHATDQDEGINDDILYTLSNGSLLINGTPSFSINATTGLITVNVPILDREEHPMYTLQIMVRHIVVKSQSLISTHPLLFDLDLAKLMEYLKAILTN